MSKPKSSANQEEKGLLEKVKIKLKFGKKEAAPPDPAHVKLLSQNFDFIDKDHSGHLTRDEICACLELFGFSTSAAKTFIQQFDSNKDGRICKKEFMDAVHKLKASQITEAQLRALFRKADKNNSGKICSKELQQYLKENHNIVSMEQVQAWIKQHDNNKDQQLNYEEFLDFLRKHL